MRDMLKVQEHIVRATALDQCDAKFTPGKSPAAGTRLPSTRTREGTQE